MIVDRFPEINRYMRIAAISCCGMLLAAIPTIAQQSQTQNPTAAPKESGKAAKPGTYEILGAFTDPEITESSGVVMASPSVNPKASQAFWTFNDSGGKPALFRVDVSGKTTATINIASTFNVDWESMCTFDFGDKHYLAIADVGDNLKRRKKCHIYVFPEPVAPLPKTANCKEDFVFTYEDGPKNCEAISYNHDDNSFWLVEKVHIDGKRKTPAGIYRLENPLLTRGRDAKEKPLVAKKVGTLNVRSFTAMPVTGMAFSPDRKQLVIRSYFVCYLFTKADCKTWLETVQQTNPRTIICPIQSQGEAICFMPDSKSLLLTSEGAKASIWKINLQQEPAKPASPKKPQTPAKPTSPTTKQNK